MHRTSRGGSTAKRATKGTKKRAAKRELIDTGSDKRFVRRGAKGQYKIRQVPRTGPRKKAKTKVKSGQGDEGDR